MLLLTARAASQSVPAHTKSHSRPLLTYGAAATGYEIILTGDFNDYDAQVLDVKNSMPVTSVLDIVKGSANGGVADMYNVAEMVTQTERYTAWCAPRPLVELPARHPLSAVTTQL